MLSHNAKNFTTVTSPRAFDIEPNHSTIKASTFNRQASGASRPIIDRSKRLQQASYGEPSFQIMSAQPVPSPEIKRTIRAAAAMIEPFKPTASSAKKRE